MTEIELKDPFQDINLTENKLREYERAYQNLKEQVITQERDISYQQMKKIKDNIQAFRNLQGKTQTIRIQCEAKTAKNTKDIEYLKKQLNNFQTGNQDTIDEEGYKTKIKVQQKKYIENCKKRLNIAQSADIEKLKNLDIEQRKSLAHELFKWILVTLYMEPENKYYWPNFKEQAIQQPEGRQDLKQRLGKINAFNAKEEQRIKTVRFVESYDKIKDCQEFNEFKTQIDKIYQISLLFLDSTQIGRRVRDYETKISEFRKNFQKIDEEQIQYRKQYDSLVQKQKISQDYINQLKKIEKILASKLKKYEEQVASAEIYLNQLSNTVKSNNFVLPTVKSQSYQRGHCQCKIY